MANIARGGGVGGGCAGGEACCCLCVAACCRLREGGSLPGVVEGNDLGTYVIKFHGAGQGPKALVAEVIVGELFRRSACASRS